MNIDNNTRNRISTHFLRGVELIMAGRKIFNVASENWTYPFLHYGDPENDRYYAEIWTDGMDYNTVFWLIEMYDDRPTAIPFMIVDHLEQREHINKTDLRNLLRAGIYWRRNMVMELPEDEGIFSDSTWSCVNPVQMTTANYSPNLFFGHASQQDVAFWMNKDCVPPRIFEKYKHSSGNWRNKKNRNTQPKPMITFTEKTANEVPRAVESWINTGSIDNYKDVDSADMINQQFEDLFKPNTY